MIKQPAIICDIDGTLALFGDRHPYDRDYSLDEVNFPVAQVLRKFAETHAIILLSGRMEKHRKVTDEWLRIHNIPYFELYMRPTDDIQTKDFDLKQEIYAAIIEPDFDVVFVLDDRKSVKRMWVSLGLFVLDCNQHDIEF